MSSYDPRAIAGTALLMIAAFIAFDTAMSLLYGQITLEQALTPSWAGFAINNPVLFAVLAVAGTLVFGKIFVNVLDSI